MINLYERTDGGGDYDQAAYSGGGVGVPSGGDSGLDFTNLLQQNQSSVPQVSSFFRKGGRLVPVTDAFRMELDWLCSLPRIFYNCQNRLNAPPQNNNSEPSASRGGGQLRPHRRDLHAPLPRQDDRREEVDQGPPELDVRGRLPEVRVPDSRQPRRSQVRVRPVRRVDGAREQLRLSFRDVWRAGRLDFPGGEQLSPAHE